MQEKVFYKVIMIVKFCRVYLLLILQFYLKFENRIKINSSKEIDHLS